MEKKHFNKPIVTAIMLAIFILFSFVVCKDTGSNIPVESISIDLGDQSFHEGTIVPLTFTVLPEDASNKSVEWSSDNESVAAVNENGEVTAISVGEAVITATAKDGSGAADSVTITVIKDPPAVVIPFRWTFQEEIPGWTSYYVSYTNMNTDAEYLNNMTLLGSKHSMRWLREEAALASGFSNGCIQTTGNTVAFLEIKNVQGPFNISFRYTNISASGAGSRYPVLYINGEKIKEGTPSAAGGAGLTTGRILEYNYFFNDKVDIQLGSVSAFRLFDVILAEVTVIPVNSIVIDGGDFSLVASGAGKQLTASVLPMEADDKTLTWSSSDTSVAAVNETTGYVTGVGEGTAVITALAKDGSGVSGTVTVTVTPILVEDITIVGGDFSIVEGNTKNLTASVLPNDASNKSIIWSSGNTEIAEISVSGIVTAVSHGQTTITASASDESGVSDTITITVTESQGPMTPQEIFNSLKGQKVTTFGWADMANGGAGLSYTNPANLTLIDDATYPASSDKLWAFIDANFTSRPSINVSTGVISGGTLNDNPKFIIISGDIDLSGGRINDNDKSFYDQFEAVSPFRRINGDIIVNLGSNTTIIGINNARIKFGGIRINNKSNIIIRNITFWDAHGSTENDTSKPGYSESKASIDGLVVQGTSDGVWVDHCLFTNGTCNDMIRNYNHDGGFDIPRGKNITVSWTEFTNIDKVMLVAGSDTAANAVAEDRQITLHHNYFHKATQRMPRTRGTQMHVYNNYYDNIGVVGNNGSFMGPGWGAQFIVENNFFGSKLGDRNIEWFTTPQEHPARFYYNGNNRTNSSWWGKVSDPKPWQPPYNYVLDDNAVLPEMIPGRAGPTLVFNK
ncbi:MAG: Ig-like domain-containing protein [Treponema sp.]|nr:Ig-like domain-containing protein [Treponema sp.]